MNSRSFAVFDAFTEVPFGGSPAALVDNAADLDEQTMQQIAIEFAAPATGFVSAVSSDCVKVRFFSTQTEYPMCGHGSIALVTWLLERGLISPGDAGGQLTLQTPASEASVYLQPGKEGRVIVSLSLRLASFVDWQGDQLSLLQALNLDTSRLHADYPIGFTDTDFRHLVIALRDLDDMQVLQPNFDALGTFCRQQGIDTVMLFARQTVNPSMDFHCREFAPAVGAAEVPASGTTNRALACYLHQYQVMPFAAEANTVIQVEQGVEMARPSQIQSTLTTRGGQVIEVRVGGLATKTLEGELAF